MTRTVVYLTLIALTLQPAMLLAEQTTPNDWYGYDRATFQVDGRDCTLVAPHTPAPGNPWVWRTEFFGHEPQADVALLERGFHVAWIDISNMYGAPIAMGHMDALYEHLTTQRRLSAKPTLFGFSRGGLSALNWAALHPERVSAIYLDAPVCDFKSWPGGKGRLAGSPDDWQRLLRVYGLSEAQALQYRLNPLDQLEPLAKAGVPILSVCGQMDEVVPIEENTGQLEQRYRQLGGSTTVITKPFCLHHPHSLTNPDPIVRFVLQHTPGFESASLPSVEGTPYGYDYFVSRGGLDNCRIKFDRERTGRVVFLGGSITQMEGWRNIVCNDLQRRFPNTAFDFINAGIPSTGSTPGAFRFVRDVLAHGPVDLLFEEAAVNDETNGRTEQEQVRGMEGIVRHARLSNPAIDVIVLHFAEPAKTKVYREGRTPSVIVNHERVAERYDVPSIDLAREVAERINAGEFTWENDFVDLHPSPFGQALYARSIGRLFDAAWREPLTADAQLTPHPLPEPIDEKSYASGQLVDIHRADAGPGWRVEPAWRPADSAPTRSGFADVPMLIAEQPGAALRFDFEGTAVGLFVAAGPDAGTIEYRVDQGPWKTRDLFTPWSGQLHLPWAYVLEADLTSASHTLYLRVAKTAHASSVGHAVRIAHFLVNSPDTEPH